MFKNPSVFAHLNSKIVKNTWVFPKSLKTNGFLNSGAVFLDNVVPFCAFLVPPAADPMT